jgi:hypothetical protein
LAKVIERLFLEQESVDLNNIQEVRGGIEDIMRRKASILVVQNERLPYEDALRQVKRAICDYEALYER